MTAQPGVAHVAAPSKEPAPSALRILRVIPPEPRYGPGTYDVRLELSRPLTDHERHVLAHLTRRVHTIGRRLVVGDTTLERVRERAHELSCLVSQVEAEGSRLEQEDERRAREYRERVSEEQARLTALANSIRFEPADLAES